MTRKIDPKEALVDYLYYDCWSPKLSIDIKHVKKLIALGADINLKSVDGRTPLHYACQENDIELVKLLLDLGADKEMRSDDTHGCLNPLFWAIRTGFYIEVVELLIAKGCSVNARIEGGLTLLHFASVRSGYDKRCTNFDVVKLLVESGANINAKNDKGQTSFDVVEGIYQTSMDRLKECGKKPSVIDLQYKKIMEFLEEAKAKEFAKMVRIAGNDNTFSI